MKLMPQGDFYLWYCDWCDTRNRTIWTRVEQNELCCAACQKKFPAYDELSQSTLAPLSSSGKESGDACHLP